PQQKLIGFAAQTDDLINKGLDKLKRKKLDMICINNISVAGADNSEITVIGKLPEIPMLPENKKLNGITIKGSKLALAHEIIDLVKTL
ncbi:MAG: CoA biosynthesis bifunctional protein CoaBC, partial [Candidatus Cloacimonetes bacterium]|nr:CoA biosynthesis bifunctional protein CoaBC [Candidatus Cloacimonadota bacterium]